MIRAALIIAAALLTGCVQMREREYYHPTVHKEPCQVWRRDDGGPWYCVSRRGVMDDLCKIGPCSR